MKYSKYNYVYSDKGNVVLINTFSNCIVILSETEYENFLDKNTLPQDLKQLYKSQGFIIEDDVDELEIMKFDNSYYTSHNMPRFRILTTTGCNAKCPYCYEDGAPVIVMDDLTATKVASFIKQHSDGKKSVYLEWFGGEPLTNYKVIKIICENLTLNHYKFISSVVTNGLLMSRNLIGMLKDVANVEKVQVTLDGVEEKYEKIKGVARGSFQNVIENILNAANSDITVYVRMNLGDNYEELCELIEYLSKRIGFHYRIFYYVYPLFEKTYAFDRNTILQTIKLNDKLVECNLMKFSDLYKFSYRKTRCFATNYNGYTIGPDGQLYNCTHLMKSEGAIGTIDSYSMYNTKRLRFTALDVSDECQSCVLYPICKGGCRAAELGLADLNQCNMYKTCLDVVAQKLLSYYIGKEVENNENHTREF